MARDDSPKNSIPGLMMEHYTFSNEPKAAAAPAASSQESNYVHAVRLHNQKRRLLIIGVVSLAVVVLAMWLLNMQSIFANFSGQGPSVSVKNITGDLSTILTSLDEDAERAKKLLEASSSNTTPVTEEELTKDFLTVIATTAATIPTEVGTATSTTTSTAITTQY